MVRHAALALDELDDECEIALVAAFIEDRIMWQLHYAKRGEEPRMMTRTDTGEIVGFKQATAWLDLIEERGFEKCEIDVSDPNVQKAQQFFDDRKNYVIRQLKKKGKTITSIAKAEKTHATTITRVLDGETKDAWVESIIRKYVENKNLFPKNLIDALENQHDLFDESKETKR